MKAVYIHITAIVETEESEDKVWALADHMAQSLAQPLPAGFSLYSTEVNGVDFE